MGTNYYLVCKTCKKEVRHIGKQSFGWNFCANFTQVKLQEIMKANPNLKIHDEYGRKFTQKQFFKHVTEEWTMQLRSDEFMWS